MSMDRRVWLIGFLSIGTGLGCSTSNTSLQNAPSSVVRPSLIASATTLLEKNLKGEGWTAVITETSKRGQTAVNSDEEWDENSAWVTFIARRDNADPRLLTPSEAAQVLKAFRLDIRRLVFNANGDPLDSSEGEAYRERWLIVPYQIDSVSGTVKVTIKAASDKPEETVNRLEVVIREQRTKK